jgi:hypothetical protein
MTFNTVKFFDALANHLVNRSDDVRALAVMAAMEHWIQFEAAALVDRNRKALGIGGVRNEDGTPAYWVACEPSKVDLWIEGDDEALAIEFKVVHNNKNLYTKVSELRRDLATSKAVPNTEVPVRRVGVILSVCVQYMPPYGRRYPVLRASPKDAALADEEFEAEVVKALADSDPWYQGRASLSVVKGPAEIADLRQAHYVDKSKGGAVKLWLVGSA